ncbi:MAG TPA: RsmE family RNA methyltransferase [Acidimicrobiia bacterium]|nr:RsmE family RNA methyltransferase [Acidimicrobiia bacterium]
MASSGLPIGCPADVAASAHVYVDRLDDALRVGDDDGHHLVRVRRLRSGETVTAADGYGRWRAYSVTGVEAGVVDLRATSDLAHEPAFAPGVVIACSLTKGERPELVVQKLTELGVDAVFLVRAARSVVKWDEQREATAMERLRRVARESGAQCRRARLPVVDGPMPVTELAGLSGLVVADRGGVTAAELAEPAGGQWVVAVGPEGGFDDDELALLARAPRLAVGHLVLRAETAAIATAAALTGRRSPEVTG